MAENPSEQSSQPEPEPSLPPPSIAETVPAPVAPLGQPAEPPPSPAETIPTPIAPLGSSAVTSASVETAPAPVAPLAPAAQPPRPSHTGRNILIVLGIALVLLVCAGVCVVAVGGGLFQAAGSRDDVQKVVDTFMVDMAKRDSNAAYNLFSTRAQRHVSHADVEKLLEGNNFVLFQGYQSISVEGIQFTAAANTNPDVPQGTVATVSGTVSYLGGFTGHFEAVLEQEDGAWRLFNINVTVPPDKIKNGTNT